MGKATNTIAVRVDDELFEKIKRIADSEHRKPAEFARHCIECYIEQRKNYTI